MNTTNNSLATQEDRMPFFTSSLELNNLRSIVKEMESYEGSDPEASPEEIMKRAQAEWKTVTKELSGEWIKDDANCFLSLNALHRSLIHASIAARVHWAYTKINRLITAIRSGQIPLLQETKNERKTWWQNGGIDWDTDAGKMIWDTERAYESAAIAVQSLPAKNQGIFAHMIADLRSMLCCIHITHEQSHDDSRSSDNVGSHAH